MGGMIEQALGMGKAMRRPEFVRSGREAIILRVDRCTQGGGIDCPVL